MPCGTSSLRNDSPELPPRLQSPLSVAVSDCLLGSAVRFDGGHKRSSLCHDELEGLFQLHGICPEVGIGMGVPRDPIRLVGDVAAPRAVGIKDPSVDVTAQLQAYARLILPTLADVCGYIFIENSPSCGLFGVKVYEGEGTHPATMGRGVYAAEIVRCRPELPVEESGRLKDAVLRENFVTRVFAFAHWRATCALGLTAARLLAFHSAYKYLLMVHSVLHYQRAGRRLSDLSGDVEAAGHAYIQLLMDGLARPASRGGHANVLQHLQGYLGEAFDAAARHELATLIHSYRRGEIGLLAPLTLLRRHLQQFSNAYVLAQIYLEPYPQAAAR